MASYIRGDLADAERIGAAVLRREPDHFDALHLMGVIAARTRRLERAVEFMRKAVAISPKSASAHGNLGHALYGLGRLQEALASYDQAVTLAPGEFDAHSIRGNVLNDLKRPEDALASDAQAIALRPNHAETYNSRGVVLRALKRPQEALASYDRAIALKPDYVEAYSNRGNVLRDLKRPQEALTSCEQAIALRPDFAEAHSNRGHVLRDLQRPQDALASYDQAIALRPDHAEAYNSRGAVLRGLQRMEEALASYDKAIGLRPGYAEAYNGRGNVLRDLHRLEEALASYDKALALRTHYPEAHNNRGVVLRALNRPDESLASFDLSITLAPDQAHAHNNRGNVLRDLLRPQEALASYERAIALRPDFADAYNARGNALMDLERPQEALASYDRAVALAPGSVENRMNRAAWRLRTGRYREGWDDYEWRWQAKDFTSKPPAIDAPRWQGEELGGRRILVFTEQGLGDVIQFARYLPLLVECHATVSWLGLARLARLLRPLTTGVELVSAVDSKASYDFQCALISQPFGFGTELSSIPVRIPYLTAEPELVARWGSRLGRDGFKVGIAWQGKPMARVDEGRSIPLAHFFPLARLTGVRLISLQKEHGLDQLVGLPADCSIESLGDDFDSGPDAFIDTAAVMQSLDLIITSDTSIAHLAGALGRPAWVALKHVPDWRWLLGRDDSPWYPTLRLFRQTQRDDWASVFAAIGRELRALLAARSS